MERGAAMDIRYHQLQCYSTSIDIILWDLKLGVFVDKLEEELRTSDTTITMLMY